MGVLLYHVFAFSALFTYGLYHLISAARSHHLRPQSHHHHPLPSKPYYPLPLSSHRHHLLRHLPLYLSLLLLLFSALRSLLLSSASSPHRFTSLQSSSVILLFLLLALSVLLAHSHPHLLPLPADLLFLLSSLAFALLAAVSRHSAAAYPSSDLQSKCASLSSLISAFSAAAALALAVNPFLFVAELALAASVSFQGLWSLQTGLSLYVEGFIPEGCHRLLDVPVGVEGSTRCDLEESRVRAAAMLDLAFVMHVTFVAVVAVAVYAAVARAAGGNVRRSGSYEALPTSSSGGMLSETSAEMKTVGKNAMQA